MLPFIKYITDTYNKKYSTFFTLNSFCKTCTHNLLVYQLQQETV